VPLKGVSLEGSVKTFFGYVITEMLSAIFSVFNSIFVFSGGLYTFKKYFT